MEKIKLDYTHDGTVAQIILDDGKGNVLDAIMMKDLLSVFAGFKENKNLKLITFEGAGKHFSFGASVEEHTKEKCSSMLNIFHQLFYNIVDMSIPTMAKISGQCLGGGMELALICNFLFADKTAMMGQPEIILGVYAPPASVLLPLKLASARAEELLLTGNSISAERAEAIGLLNNVFEDKDTMNIAIDEWINKNILKKSASSLRWAVKASRIKFNRTLLKELPRLERMYNAGLMVTNDANEGINSFMEKRKAIWKNC